MSWFQQNRFLGSFLALLTLATISSGWFLLHAKGVADEQRARLDGMIVELNRLRASRPFPNEENLRKTRAQTDSYRASLRALEQELTSRMFPRRPLQPNEFQAQLRQAVIEVSERARAARVQLPENFNLGFDEYATSLPNGLAAPRLGRQLQAIEWIVNTLIDAHPDALNSLARSALPEETNAATATPAPGKSRAGKISRESATNEKIVDATPVSVVFAGSPAATRKILNQIASANDQFYIIRTLEVKNQVDKGPKRGEAAATIPTIPPSRPAGASNPAGANKTAEPRISFIVGSEHLNVAAKIEIARFNVPKKETP